MKPKSALFALFAALPFLATASSYRTVQESGGTFAAGKNVVSGMTSRHNVVPGSFQAAVGEFVWNDDGNGHLVFADPNGGTSSGDNPEGFSGAGTIQYVSGAWALQLNPAMDANRIVTLRYGYFTDDAGFVTVEESAGTFMKGSLVTSGKLAHGNIVPGSLQVSTDGLVWHDTGNGSLAFLSPYGEVADSAPETESVRGSGVVLYPSGAWSVQLRPAIRTNAPLRVRYTYFANGDVWGSYCTIQESGGTFPAGKNVVSGKTTRHNVVPGSFQAVVGEHVWNDDGTGNLVFVDPNGADDGSSDDTEFMMEEFGGPTSSSKTCFLRLSNARLVPGSVTVRLGSSPNDAAVAFADNGDGTLVSHGFSGSGNINYATGAIVVSFDAAPSETGLSGSNLFVDYRHGRSADVVPTTISGSGTIQYASGAWALQLNPAMFRDQTVVLRYSYYMVGSGFVTVEENAGTFAAENRVASGMASHPNIVNGSLQVSTDGFVWHDAGSGSLAFLSPNGEVAASETSVVKGRSIGNTATGRKSYTGQLVPDLVPGSVWVVVGENGGVLRDNGSGLLVGSGVLGSGTVNYASGSVQITFDSPPDPGLPIEADFEYVPQVLVVPLSGAGTVLYSSGAWTVLINPAMPGNATIRIRYSYWHEAPPHPVHRFYSKNYKGHFFTINEGEKDDLVANNPNWKYEGTAYRAFKEQAPGTTALYRFYSKNYRGHFFTVNEGEKDNLIATNPNWKYEGVAYYVYPQEVEGSVPVYRFWSKNYRHHFYTTNEGEKNDLIARNPNWAYEGVAFWALPDVPPQTNVSRRDSGDGRTGTGTEPADDPGRAGTRPTGWALVADGAEIAIPGVTELGDFLVETRAEAPDADELAGDDPTIRNPDNPASGGADGPALRLTLPDGPFDASLWSATGETLSENAAETAFDFPLPASGVWHWLRVRGEDGADAFSVWLRAE